MKKLLLLFLVLVFVFAASPDARSSAGMDITLRKDTGFTVIEWTALPGARLYYVFRGTLAAPFDDPIVLGSTTGTAFPVTDLTDGNNYFYEVVSFP